MGPLNNGLPPTQTSVMEALSQSHSQNSSPQGQVHLKTSDLSAWVKSLAIMSSLAEVGDGHWQVNGEYLEPDLRMTGRFGGTRDEGSEHPSCSERRQTWAYRN